MIRTSSVKGQVLMELLIAITVGVVLAAIGAQLASVSLNAARSSRQQNEGMGLAQEGIEAMRAIARTNSPSSQGWNKLYLPPDGTGASSTKGIGNPFHPEVIGGEWQLMNSSETVVLAGNTYTRSVIIENVARASSTRAILAAYDAAYDDPSTQKVRVIVSRTGLPDIELSAYFTRFLNESTLQTNWDGILNNLPVSATSSSNDYSDGTETDNIDRTPGSLRLRTN